MVCHPNLQSAGGCEQPALSSSRYEGPFFRSDSGSNVRAKKALLSQCTASLHNFSAGDSTFSTSQKPCTARTSVLGTMLAVWVSTLPNWQGTGFYRPSPQGQNTGAALMWSVGGINSPPTKAPSGLEGISSHTSKYIASTIDIITLEYHWDLIV